MLHDRLGEAARGIVGAALAPVTALGDVDAAGEYDHGVAAHVVAHQPCEGPRPLRQCLVVAEGGPPAALVGGTGGERFSECGGRAARG
jgi:hypothetical protein